MFKAALYLNFFVIFFGSPNIPKLKPHSVNVKIIFININIIITQPSFEQLQQIKRIINKINITTELIIEKANIVS